MKTNLNKIDFNKQDNLLVIAGLGNPGEKYDKTRHNAGFIFLDTLADRLGEKWSENIKLNCHFIKHGQIILVKPSTFMNNSGEAVQKVMAYYKMLPKKLIFNASDADLSDKLLVVHDELDIDFGKYRFSVDSRAAGNNGVQSIINHLKTKNFNRLRLGIKSELLKHISGKDFVLKNFTKEEAELLAKLNQDIINEYFVF